VVSRRQRWRAEDRDLPQRKSGFCNTRKKVSEIKRAAGNGVKLVISQGLIALGRVARSEAARWRETEPRALARLEWDPVNDRR